MPQTEFMLLLQDIYGTFLNLLEGLQEHGRIIEGIISDFQEPSTPPDGFPTGSTPSTAIQDELSDVLFSAAELSNTQVARIISMRVEEHASLELPDFLAFFNESWTFVVNSEILCQRMIVGLRGVLVSQAKLFLHAFHHARLTRSAKVVEDELWNPVEITPSFQHITNIIINSAIRDAPELVIKSDSGLPISEQRPLADLETLKARPMDGFPVSSSASAKHLLIEDRTYFAVSATTEVLVLVLDYLRLLVNLTILTTDSMTRVIEFLKAFNSRTCQVVLGAGAMRSAGLKNITAKHLALASQSLSIVSELIPYVRETFRRHLSQMQSVMLIEFDKLKRDYQEHQNEIHSKLIAIMGDRLTAHIKSLQAVDWSVPKPGGGVNEYMEILVKETVTLHKVLSRYLSAQVVEYVMTQVFAAINHGLSEEYNMIELPNQDAKTRLLDDAKYLHQKLSALRNVGSLSNMLVTIVSEKSLPRPAAPPTPTRSNTLQNVGVSANQRLKGLLSGKSQTVDKALPTRTASLSRVSAFIDNSFRPLSLGSHAGDSKIVNGRVSDEPVDPNLSPPDKTPKVGVNHVDDGSSDVATLEASTGGPEKKMGGRDLAISTQQLPSLPSPSLEPEMGLQDPSGVSKPDEPPTASPLLKSDETSIKESGVC